ncbi:MAG: ATP-binding cassette domain-containing protein [Desulfovibrionaceae bacterium]|nr:ATP-binding cassette domain-containing protein [Desulfovibrionaceae bacterium]
MALIALQDISLNLYGRPLFDHCDLHVEIGDRLCLVGRNGAGKSSLLNIMAGLKRPDTGSVIYQQGTVLGYMPQEVPLQWQGSVFGVVAEVMGEAGKALAAAHAMALGTAALSTAERGAAESLMSTGEGWEKQADIETVLNHLGLDGDADFATLSGGKKRRVALARALLTSQDLLLDEPTNHLDIHTIEWLEEFLLRRARTLVFISHDRAFARRLATKMAEVDRGHIYAYACNADQFAERRELRLNEEEQQRYHFDKKLAQEEAWIRQGIKARRTRNMGRVRALQAMRVERAARRVQQGNVRLQVEQAERSGKLVLEASAVSFCWEDGYEVFHDFSTIIQRGDRIGLIGDNGAGKTTLLRVLLGELQPTKGTVRQGTRLEISYFDQLRDTLNPDETVMYAVAEGNDVVTIGGQNKHVASYLQDFLFESDRLRVPVSTLSGGERNRLLLAKLFTKPSNLLVMDEPTNDLDVETLELLEEMLDQYQGTVLLVSHDRAFLDNLVTSTLVLEGDTLVHEYVGGYTDWLRQREEPQPAPKEEKSAAPRPTPAPVQEMPKKRKLSFKEQQQRKAWEEELAALPAQLRALEAEQAALEAQLADSSLFSRDPQSFNHAVARQPQVEEAQLALLERWEELEANLAALNE